MEIDQNLAIAQLETNRAHKGTNTAGGFHPVAIGSRRQSAQGAFQCDPTSIGDGIEAEIDAAERQTKWSVSPLVYAGLLRIYIAGKTQVRGANGGADGISVFATAEEPTSIFSALSGGDAVGSAVSIGVFVS